MAKRVLFHYYPYDTFKKFIETGNIRFSELDNLNDPDGLTFLWENFVKNGQTGSNIYRDYFYGLEGDSIRWVKNHAAYFVFSLVEEGDSPYMWRNYSDNGDGICIGIDVEKLIRWAKRISLKFPSKKAHNSYCGGITMGRVKYFCSPGMLEYFKTTDENYSAPFIKHDSFEREREHRLIVTATKRQINFGSRPVDDDLTDLQILIEALCFDDKKITANVEWDDKKRRLFPFVDVPFDFDILESVRIGPRCGSRKSEIKMLLSSYGRPVCNVVNSGERVENDFEPGGPFVKSFYII